MTNLFISKKIVICFFLFSFLINGQESKIKNVIIVNNDKLAMGFSNIEINNLKLHPGFKNCIVRQYTNDSIEIKVPSSVFLFLTIKKKIFRFSLNNKDNYFLYKCPSLFNKLQLRQVTEKELIKLKKKKYIKEKIKEFNLEQ